MFPLKRKDGERIKRFRQNQKKKKKSKSKSKKKIKKLVDWRRARKKRKEFFCLTGYPSLYGFLIQDEILLQSKQNFPLLWIMARKGVYCVGHYPLSWFYNEKEKKRKEKKRKEKKRNVFMNFSLLIFVFWLIICFVFSLIAKRTSST